jgi:MFS family permease
MTTTSLPTASRGFIALYAIGYVGAYVALITPVATTLALKVGELDPAGKEASLGLIAAIGALMAIVSNALSGALSDRTRSSLGRRRPWIIWGSAGGVVALAIVGFAPTLVVATIGWVLAQLTLNMVLAALQALLPDQVPLEQRARVSAVLGISQQVSPLLGIGIAYGVQAAGGGIGLMFLVPAIVGAIMLGILVARIKDVPHDPTGKFSFGEFVRGFSIPRGKRSDFGWAWFGRFFVILGFAVYTTYQVYFIGDRLKVSGSNVVLMQLYALLIFSAVLTVSAIISGRISDRTGRRKPFVFAAAAIVGVGLTSLPRRACPCSSSPRRSWAWASARSSPSTWPSSPTCCRIASTLPRRISGSSTLQTRCRSRWLPRSRPCFWRSAAALGTPTTRRCLSPVECSR